LTQADWQKDLVVLVADKNMEHAVRSLLTRPRSLRTRAVTVDSFVHPHHDAGCRLTAHNFLRPFTNRYAQALVMFDRVGSGHEPASRNELERQVESQLSASGWGERGAAVVLDPELEAWVWTDSPHVAAILGWQQRDPNLRTWMVQKGFLTESETKPIQPKEAMETALRDAGKPRSSSLYAQLAAQVSLERCSDPAFLKFKGVLQSWFPPNT